MRQEREAAAPAACVARDCDAFIRDQVLVPKCEAPDFLARMQAARHALGEAGVAVYYRAVPCRTMPFVFAVPPRREPAARAESRSMTATTAWWTVHHRSSMQRRRRSSTIRGLASKPAWCATEGATDRCGKTLGRAYAV
jgi:hypothetical protein